MPENDTGGKIFKFDAELPVMELIHTFKSSILSNRGDPRKSRAGLPSRALVG